MKSRILNTLTLCLCLLLMSACQHEDTVLGSNELYGTSLTIVFKCNNQGIQTRGVEDLNDDGDITEEEMIQDGRLMYRLGVFIAEGTKVVASTILEADDNRFINDNTEATVTFENLDYRKTYQLYAVANYGNYGTLASNITSLTDYNITGTHNVTASSSNLCKGQTTYPLSMKREIQLSPGNNTVSGELVRTYARLRINVRNQSAVKDLMITNLSFPTRFTQSSANLFTEGGAASVSPVVTSNDAITPFQPNMVIPKIDESGKVTETTIFDAYLLESTGGDYQYTLGLKYEGETTEGYTVSDNPVGNTNNIEDGAMYVIYNTNASRYLYTTASAAGASNVSAGSSYLNANGELNPNYVWRFKRAGNNMYTIESMGASGFYMQSSKLTQSAVPMTDNPGNSDYFTASNSGSNLRFQSTSSSRYLAVSRSYGTVYGHSGSSNQNYRNFVLYKVEGGTMSSTKTHTETIPINILDNETGQSSAMTSLRRNDFVQVLVNVSYNEKTGELNFEVADWEKIDGEVTFD